MRRVFILFVMLIALFLVSHESMALFQTAAHLLAQELVNQIEPIHTTIEYLEETSIILAIGRDDGARVGQVFEIYSYETNRYIGLVRATEVRSRNTKAEVLEEKGEMSPGDQADEVPGGRIAIYGFLNNLGYETRFSRSFQEALRAALSGYAIFQVMETMRIKAILEEKGLSYQDLVEKDIPEAGLLLGAHLLVIGSTTELDESILVNARIQEALTGRMLANSSVRLAKTPHIKELLDTTYGEVAEAEPPQPLTSIHYMEIRPETAMLYTGESLDLQVFCYDEEGFIIHNLAPQWSSTGDFVELSSIEGNRITLYGQRPGQGQVRVLIEGISRLAQIEVLEAPELNRISFFPQELEMAVGESYSFQVEGWDQYGNALEISPTWRIISGFGHLSSTKGKDVELTALAPGEILLEVEEGSFLERATIFTFIPMEKAPGLPFPSGLDNVVTESVEKDFWIAKTAVTYELWSSIRRWAMENGYSFANAGREGSHGLVGAGPHGMEFHPVTTVSWSDSIVWCNALSEYLGYDPVYRYNGEIIRDAKDSYICANAQHEDRNGFRLPTSDEWELASRYRGTDSSFGAIEHPQGSNIWWSRGDFASGASGPAFGEEIDKEATKRAAWYRANTESSQPVGKKPENGNYLGLYDMSGNIWEWCFDGSSAGRVIRGGCWMSISFYQQVGFSFTNDQSHASSVKGFRLARSSL